MAQYVLDRDGFAGGDRAELNRMFGELYASVTQAESHEADQSNPHGVTASQAGAIPATQKGAASGVAPLDAGSRIPSAHIPPVALSETFVVNSQSAQLALTAEEGDVAVRTDQSRSYIHNGGTAGTMADWTELARPPDAIQSVDGRTGTVSLSDRYAPSSHVGSRDGHPAATATQDGRMAAADKAKLIELVTVGPGLAGNGRAASPLVPRVHGFASADRAGAATLTVPYSGSHKIPLTNELTDADSCFAASVYTAPLTGVFTVYAFTRVFDLADGNLVQFFVYKNGSRPLGLDFAVAGAPRNGAMGFGGSGVLRLASGDKLELGVNVSGSGGSPNIPGEANTYLAVGYWGGL